MAYRVFSFKTIFFIFLLFCDDIFKLTNWDIQYGFFVQIHITIGILNAFFIIVVIFDVIFFRSWWCISCWSCGALCSWLIFRFCVLINVGKALLCSIVVYLKYRVICKEKKWSFFFISTNWHLKDSISNFYTFIYAHQCYATNIKCFRVSNNAWTNNYELAFSTYTSTYNTSSLPFLICLFSFVLVDLSYVRVFSICS